MTWAILGLGCIVIGILSLMAFRLTVTVSRMSSNVSATIISFDQRAHNEREAHRQQVQGLIDRLMSLDWEAVRLHEGTKDTEYGGFIAPLDQLKEVPPDEGSTTGPEEPVEPPEVYMETRSWGHVGTIKNRVEELDEADKLAREDDLDDHETDTERRLRQARERGVVA